MIHRLFDGATYGPPRTHEPALAAAVVAARPGPVLELGIGFYSTPLLHALCAAMGRALLSLDTAAEWVEHLAQFRSASHRLVALTQWDDAMALTSSNRWSVVFVDHAPAERRVVEIAELADSTEFMVVHDSEDPIYNYGPTFAKFAHRYDYRRLTPWTSILSNERPFPCEL